MTPMRELNFNRCIVYFFMGSIIIYGVYNYIFNCSIQHVRRVRNLNIKSMKRGRASTCMFDRLLSEITSFPGANYSPVSINMHINNLG